MALEIENTVGAATKDSLGDALGTILDKGLIIAGDISIHLVKTELLTIKIRLVVASVERAEEMGIDWWKHDQFLSGGANLAPKAIGDSQIDDVLSGRSQDRDKSNAG